jgi:hypothetical protein
MKVIKHISYAVFFEAFRASPLVADFTLSAGVHHCRLSALRSELQGFVAFFPNNIYYTL